MYIEFAKMIGCLFLVVSSVVYSKYIALLLEYLGVTFTPFATETTRPLKHDTNDPPYWLDELKEDQLFVF